MKTCLTIPFLPEFSGCLVDNPSCHFAVRCGFSYHCHHPNHRDFHTTIGVSGERVNLMKKYKQLKETRRRQYLEQVLKSDIPSAIKEEKLEFLKSS